MKSTPHDQPDLTAYVLGELNSVESARVRQLLTQSPEARAEYQRISKMITALQEQAPAIPRRTLNPRQRETILAMGQPKVSSNPGRDHARRIAWGVARFAAAACVTAGAFALGMKYSDRLDDLTKGASNPVPNAHIQNAGATAIPEVAQTQPDTSKEKSATVTPPAPQAPEVKSIAAATADKTEIAVTANLPIAKTAPAVAEASAPKTEPAPQPVVAPAPKPAPAAPSLKAFVVAKAQPESSFVLQPKLLRPKVQVSQFAGVTMAAPLPDHVKNAPKPVVPRKPEPQPALVIHSWKAEVAPCPWDSSRRLMRFVAQIPVDQAAIDVNEQDYRLQVKFDPAQVQGYRLIREKHDMPTGSSKLAWRFAWYEIIPTKNYAATRDKPATLGVMEIAQPRGVPANISGPPLALVDSGKDGNDWGDAFVFETAMVGFNMLLQGTDNVGSLNHRLVLDLAQQSKGEDSNGERTKFIHAVQQAQRAAGL